LKEGVEDPEDIVVEGVREVIMDEIKEKNDDGEPITFRENGSFKISKVFPTKLPDLRSFSIPCVIGKLKIERALFDLGVSVSLMPYSMFHKLHLDHYNQHHFHSN